MNTWDDDGLLIIFDDDEPPPRWLRTRVIAGYCWAHRKQLATAVSFGAGLLEAIQKAH